MTGSSQFAWTKIVHPRKQPGQRKRELFPWPAANVDLLHSSSDVAGIDTEPKIIIFKSVLP